MTGLLHEKEFSRKSFIKGGGALVVGFSLLGGTVAGNASAVPGPPAMNDIDSWLRVNPDNTVTVYLGKEELGQGSTTGLRMIAAEELNLPFTSIDSDLHEDTAGDHPAQNQGPTVGSGSISGGGPQLRSAATYAYQALLGMASAKLGVPVASLTASNGVISGGGGQVKYSDLVAGKLFTVTTPGTTLGSGVAPAKPISQYTIVGTRIPRIDIPDKVAGTYTYVHNVRVPGMLHGRVVRPRGQGSYGAGAPIVSVDKSSIAHIAGAQIVQVGNFLGVVAPHEFDAIQAAAQLKVTWNVQALLPGVGNQYAAMQANEAAGLVTTKVAAQTGNVASGFAQAATVLAQTYRYPYNVHGSIGPACAIADVTPTSAFVFSNTQGIYRLQGTIAQTINLPLNSVRVQYWEGASAFGHTTSDDAAQAAAVLSQQVGKPVRMQFMRWDDHGYDFYGPLELNQVRGGIDAKGNLVAFDYASYVPYGMNAQETTNEWVGFGPLTPLSASAGGADTTNSGSQYNIPNRRVITKSVPLSPGYLKTGPLRGPGAPQSIFAAEQMIDELAHAANMDPVAFRVQNIATTTDPAYGTPGGTRWSSVLNAVAQAANWTPRVAASNLAKGDVVTGRGIALGSFASSQAGVVAEIQVNKKTGKITPIQMYAAQNAGLAINPALVENQMSGAMIMGTSRGLFEEITFDKSRVTSLDWVTYPIMRFKDAPKVTTVVVQRTDLQSTGSGEPPNCPAAAAVANAFFDATGVRIRQAPMTPARVRAVLKAAGVA
jgi:CO/xanthine dehydrogenase Mo-binding subunit